LCYSLGLLFIESLYPHYYRAWDKPW
jgi:hypothetical protein